uniref:Glycoprotein hormone subunit beta domain-containing protein n=1 Tax=Oncorhynchus kisutch TaxID=8019 RepID=A0A8C7GGN9_ONCKI
MFVFTPCVTLCRFICRTALLYLGQVAIVNENLFSTCLPGCPNVPSHSNPYLSRFSTVYLHVCTYRDVPYETIRLPDCPPWVDPCVTYPVALSCDCTCSQTSDCTIESLQPDF